MREWRVERGIDQLFPRKDDMEDIVLTPEQETEAERIEDNLKAAAAVEIRRMARLIASKE